jgi:hypothetical protein
VIENKFETYDQCVQFCRLIREQGRSHQEIRKSATGKWWIVVVNDVQPMVTITKATPSCALR